MAHVCMIERISRENREAFGSECDKFSGGNDLGMAAEIPERVATLAKRSEKISQVLGPPGSSAVFGSDSRGEEFFC